MKKVVLTVAMMAFLMGGICTTASAKEVASSVKVEVAVGDKWDKLLDEYEKYVDQYIKAYKKAKNGDVTAASECLKLAEKAQKVAEKLEDAEDEMTSAQMKRYLKITEKMTKALAES